MDRIEKALVFDGQVLVSVIDIKDIVEELRKLQNLSITAATVLGRALVIGAYMTSNLKGKGDKMSITINGGGVAGNIVVTGNAGDIIRGYISKPQVEVPLKENGSIDVSFAVGTEGTITVIKDLGLKEPYVGTCEIVSGRIADDFAYYYVKSEQQPIAIALGVKIEDNKVVSAGGVFVKPMPDCKEEILVVLEDIMTKFDNLKEQLTKESPLEIIIREFGHFEHKILEANKPKFKCICSQERMDSIIKTLPAIECFEALKTDRKMEIVCHFCNTKYNYQADDVIKLRNNGIIPTYEDK